MTTCNIGICIPTYNRPVELNTLLKKIPSRIHVYVSDNGLMLTEAFKAQHANVHFRGTAGTPVPMFVNWNFAAKMADNDWVAIPSDDDVYYENSFDIIEKTIESHADADLIIFGHNVVDDNYEIVSSWTPEYACHMAPDGFFPFRYSVNARMPSIFFRRRLLENLDFFDERFLLTASDSDLIQRALLTGRSVFVPEIVSGYRTWRNSATYSTISTRAWMVDVEKWAVKMESTLQQIPAYEASAGTIRAEIFARNLHAGLYHLRCKGLRGQAVRHFLNTEFPWRATLSTKMKLIYQLVRPC